MNVLSVAHLILFGTSSFICLVICIAFGKAIQKKKKNFCLVRVTHSYSVKPSKCIKVSVPCQFPHSMPHEVNLQFEIPNSDPMEDCKSSNDFKYVEQYAQSVVDFSSQYGSDISISYTAHNILGKPSKYPAYGDFPQTFVMKTYGTWWNEAPSKLEPIMPQNCGPIKSQDYIDLAFEEYVTPAAITVFETFNPGSVVRIWACKGENHWALLWEGPPQVVERKSRAFQPNLKCAGFQTNLLRLEFDHSRLDYYTEIDAVLLCGYKVSIKVHLPGCLLLSFNQYSDDSSTSDSDNSDDCSPSGTPWTGTKPITDLTATLIKRNIHIIPPEVDIPAVLSTFISQDLEPFYREFESSVIEIENSDNKNKNGSFDILPDETILNILSYLDLVSLFQCAKVNKQLNSLATDALLYTSLNLKPYWHKITSNSLMTLANRCQYLKKIDLSWCGNYDKIQSKQFCDFIKECGQRLTHLRLDCCKFTDDDCIITVSQTCKSLEELLLRNCSVITRKGFMSLASLVSLQRLDFYRTEIEVDPLNKILISSPNLKHINLGSCNCIDAMDSVAETLGTYNKELISIDLWKTYSLTPVGVHALSKCSKLQEIDLGWCLGISGAGDCLSALALGCPSLKKLFIGSLRGILDRDLEPFLVHCPHLEQIDLLGVKSISADMCLKFLQTFKKLSLLDISFCEQILDSDVAKWKKMFPKVCIKRSFQNDWWHL